MYIKSAILRKRAPASPCGSSLFFISASLANFHSAHQDMQTLVTVVALYSL